MSTTAPASTHVDWTRVAIPPAVVFAETPRFPAALRDATFSVVSVVFDDDTNINAGQDPNGRGTLGLCPPPRNEVVPVVFPDSDESFSAMWATAPASGWPWAAGPGHGPVGAEGPTGADEAAPLPEALRLLDLVGTDDDPYKEGGPWAYADAENCGGRVFFVTQNERYGDRVLLSAEAIDKALSRKGFATGRWAWIKHDKDTYTADEAERLPGAVEGTKKADHFHIAIQRKSFSTLGQVARAFGVPPQQVEAKPQGAFLDLVEYLTHENPGQQKKGKFLYADDEVFANFDWRPVLDDHKLARSAKAGQRASAKKLDELMLKVMQEGMTLKEVRTSEPVIYGRNLAKFKQWRSEYLVAQPPPRVRQNHYIGGARHAEQLGRTGKSVLARLLAVALYPDLDPDECYFEATDKRAPLQHYAGQPVIIWDDFLPVELLEALGGRGGVLKAFDVHPGRLDANIKNSVAALRHEVNILTRAMHYEPYIDALAGEYKGRDGQQHKAEAPEQFWGRITFAHEVTPDQVMVYVSESAVEDTQEYRDFRKIMALRVGMRGLVRTLDQIADPAEKEAAHLEIGRRVLGPVLDQHRAISAAGTRTKDDVLAELLPVIDGALVGPDELAAEEAERERQRAAAEAARTARHDAHRAYHEADPTAPPSVCTFDHQEHACTWDPARAGFDPWRVPMPA